MVKELKKLIHTDPTSKNSHIFLSQLTLLEIAEQSKHLRTNN